MSRSKKIILALWLLLTLTAISFYIAYPERFTATALRDMLDGAQTSILIVYTLVSLLRGIFLIPSTPFVIAGALLFPELRVLVFIISMLGVVAGSSYIFFFTEYLGFDRFFQERFATRFERVKAGMARYGIWIVIFWSFFPIFPTDLISYTAGATRMPYWKFLLGLIIGELPLVAFYVFAGQSLGDWLWA